MKLNSSQIFRASRWMNLCGLFLAVALWLSVVHPCSSAADVLGKGQKKLLRAGACAIDITPEKFPVSRNGGLQDRQATIAYDPLHARCLVLENGETRIAIAVCDSTAIPRDIFDAAKAKASARTGIPVENMLLSATHTHSAVTVTGVFQSEPEEAYRKFLTQQIASGIIRAAAQLEPARVGWAVGSDPTQVFNRRWVMKSGYKYFDPFGLGTDKVKMNPRPGGPELDKPTGPVDPQIGMLSVQSHDGRPIALLANYSLHYVGGVPSNMLSADYFGEFARRFTQRIGATKLDPPFVGIMSNGTSGDINNVDRRVPYDQRDMFEQIRIVALSVTDEAYRAYQQIEYHDWVPLKMREAEIDLGVRIPTQQEVARAKELIEKAGPGPYKKLEELYARETLFMADYPKKVSVKLQAIRIGELGIVSSPCETFAETGLAIKSGSPLKPTFTIELANGYNGYLPTSEQHALGGYETWRARSSYLAVAAESKLRASLLDLLHQVAATNPIAPRH